MPRKTLALISGLVLVTVILFVIALRSNTAEKQTPSTPSPAGEKMAEQPTPTSAAHSILALAPNPVTVNPGQQGSVDVTIDTSDNEVTAVQLEVAYDPTLLGNVQVIPGKLFPNPVVLINKNDVQAGRLTYAFGIAPNSQTIQGTGQVATITFTTKGGQGKQSQLSLLPTTLVTARGVASSVLKSQSGTIVTIGGGSQQGNVMIQQQETQTQSPATQGIQGQ